MSSLYPSIAALIGAVASLIGWYIHTHSGSHSAPSKSVQDAPVNTPKPPASS